MLGDEQAQLIRRTRLVFDGASVGALEYSRGARCAPASDFLHLGVGIAVVMIRRKPAPAL